MNGARWLGVGAGLGGLLRQGLGTRPTTAVRAWQSIARSRSSHHARPAPNPPPSLPLTGPADRQPEALFQAHPTGPALFPSLPLNTPQALLTASLKLFFRRAPECRAALGAALAAGVADADQEVHDRALLYHRLLQQGVGAAQNVVDVARPALTAFADAQSAETQARGRLGAWLRGVWAAARPHRPARGTTRPLGNQRRATRATSFR